MIQKQYALVHLSDEMAIDLGIATPEVIERDRQRRAAAEVAWLALPWRVRFWRASIQPRLREARLRLDHAARALRGIECEE